MSYHARKKSHFTPEPGRDKYLDAYKEAVKDNIVNDIKKKVEANLTKDEQKAITTLLKDTDIVIRPAD